MKTEQESFRAAISGATDVAALFWYGNNLGSYLNFHFMAALSGGMNDVRAAFARAIELDESYIGGGPWRALGSFLAKVPSFLGGDREKAKEAFARAIELGPDFLENYVDAAEYVYKQGEEWDEFCTNLREAITREGSEGHGGLAALQRPRPQASGKLDQRQEMPMIATRRIRLFAFRV